MNHIFGIENENPCGYFNHSDWFHILNADKVFSTQGFYIVGVFLVSIMPHRIIGINIFPELER